MIELQLCWFLFGHEVYTGLIEYKGSVTVFLYRIIDGAFTVYTAMLTIAIISSWFPELGEFKAIRFVRYYTDPYFNIFRRWIPPIGMLDISPIAAFIALQIIETIVKRMLFS